MKYWSFSQAILFYSILFHDNSLHNNCSLAIHVTCQPGSQNNYKSKTNVKNEKNNKWQHMLPGSD